MYQQSQTGRYGVCDVCQRQPRLPDSDHLRQCGDGAKINNFYCPAMPTAPEMDQAVLIHYGQNETIARVWTNPRPLGSITKPAIRYLITDTWRNIDASTIDYEDGYFRFKPGNNGLQSGYGVSAPRHASQANVLCLDFHVESVRSSRPLFPHQAYPFLWTEKASHPHLDAVDWPW